MGGPLKRLHGNGRTTFYEIFEKGMLIKYTYAGLRVGTIVAIAVTVEVLKAG